MFTVSIETTASNYSYLYLDGPSTGTVIETVEAETRKEANKAKRALIKKHDLTKYGYEYANFKNNLELRTNF